MVMTEDEIVRKYKRTAEGNVQEQRTQITVLADLNACEKSTIRRILEKHGCSVPPLPPKRKRKKNPDTIESAVEDVLKMIDSVKEEAIIEESKKEETIIEDKKDAVPEIPLAVFTACMEKIESLRGSIEENEKAILNLQNANDEMLAEVMELEKFLGKGNE